MVDARRGYRQWLTVLMGFSLFWFFTQAYNVGHMGQIPVLMGLALAAFFFLHTRLINSLGFFTEFSDLAERGPTQNLLVFGDWFEKQNDLKIVRDKGVIATPPWLSLSASFYWIICGVFFTALSGHFSISFFATAVLAIWAWSSPRALMWVPIQCVILFLTLWVSPDQLSRLIGAAIFLGFLVTYAACFASFTTKNRELTLDTWLASYWRPAGVFLLAFLLSAYFFPDEQTARKMLQVKSRWAGALARGNNSNGSGGSKSGSGSGSGGSSESGDGKSGGDSGSGAGSGREQSSAQQPAQQQPVQSQAKQAKAETPTDPEKIQKLIDLVEKALKAALVIMLLWGAFSYLTRQPQEKKSTARRRDRKKLKAVLNEIDQLGDHKFANQHEEIVATYHVFLNAMSAIGLKKLDWQTPEQFSHESAKKIQTRDVSDILTRGFSAAYYGEHALSPDEMARFRLGAKKIKNIIF